MLKLKLIKVLPLFLDFFAHNQIDFYNNDYVKKFWEYIKNHKIRFCFLTGLILLTALLFGLRYIPAVSEFWTKTVGRAYQTVVGFITSIIPYSIFEFLIVAAFIYGVLWIVLFVKKTKKNGFKQSSIKIVDLFLVVFTVLALYVGTAGMAYHRKPLELKLSDTSSVEEEKYYAISMWATDKLNEDADQLEFDENGSVKMPYEVQTLYAKLAKEYERIDGDYLTKYSAKPKQLVLFGWFYTELNITGVSFLPTGEVNYNHTVPTLDIPFVIAHEMAHSKGVMNETDANNLAMYVCINSNDPFIQYSGLINIYESLEPMAMTANDDSKMNAFINKLDNKVIRDFNYSYDFWTKHTFFKDMSEWFNNLYLKVFGSQTTESYIDQIDTDVVIIDEEPKFVLNSLSPYQEIIVDYWLKENGI